MNWIIDAGHGWLKVKKTVIEALGISEKISGCSYQRGNFVYLEEDYDAYNFLQRYYQTSPLFKEENPEFHKCHLFMIFYRAIPRKICKGFSSIRKYESYQV